MVVNTSFDRTWTAVIDVFGEKNVPIRTLERASGFVATDGLRVGAEGVDWADCGSSRGTKIGPVEAVYNVRVRGDSTRSTVQVTVLWSGRYTPLGSHTPNAVTCVTTGTWERDTEAAIKTKAEK
jgi:hypothetical protein